MAQNRFKKTVEADDDDSITKASKIFQGCRDSCKNLME